MAEVYLSDIVHLDGIRSSGGVLEMTTQAACLVGD
jgi:hypothetical protein